MPDIYHIYWDIHFWAARVGMGGAGKSFFYRSAVLLGNLQRWGL